MSENNNSQSNRSIELCRRVVTTESFIAEAKEIYGDRYDYSKVDYKNRDHRVVVTCPIHGDFQVYAREHLDGKGCPKCEKGEKFLAKLKEKYGDKFGLEQFVYESSTSPVTLICPTHGAFSRLPNQILNYSHGCPECGNDYLRQLQEAARQDAIEHKEERDQARKERYRARKEAERIKEEEIKRAEEIFAKNKFDDKIKEILKQGECEDSHQIDLFAEFSGKAWYQDFFGLDLKSLCHDDGTPIDGKQYIFLRPRHWPLHQMKVEAIQGELLNATIYVPRLEKKRFYELLLILEDIISGGFTGSMDDFIDHLQPYVDYRFKYEGVQDGYKIVFNQWTLDYTIKIKRIKDNTKRQILQKYPNEFELPNHLNR